jgi:hypothetical protein
VLNTGISFKINHKEALYNDDDLGAQINDNINEIQLYKSQFTLANLIQKNFQTPQPQP